MRILDARICLPQQLLVAEVCALNRQSPGPEAGDLARLPEARHCGGLARERLWMPEDVGTRPGVYC
jgi:hypothetical protein